ncbi:hypothetical protein JR316_0005604 [Psilocybe cubensis]|uniref:Uncharacterized protein n=2 Tax=Psilocybe cubensis TaxID=181762 RepID=A0ACB8H1L7_PSICU|nr:hypothetical protein JR316_0005604 [Psilocybe cubensis]KAH9481085.1 hypothetical protein JR316_0005604 [Psilocybe cubensis]
MFKLTIAFVSIVLFHGVFAAPVLLTTANSEATHAAIRNRGLLGGIDAGTIFEDLDPEPRQEPGLLGSSVGSLPPTSGAPVATTRRRAVSVAGAFDNFLNNLLGGTQDQGSSQRREDALPFSFDGLTAALGGSTPSNVESPSKRQLLGDLVDDGQLDNLLGRQILGPVVAEAGELVGQELTPPAGEDRRALVDTLTDASDEDNGDDEDGDNDDDDDNGEDDGGDDAGNDGDDGAQNGDDNGEDGSDVDSRSNAALPVVPGFETSGSPITNL